MHESSDSCPISAEDNTQGKGLDFTQHPELVPFLGAWDGPVTDERFAGLIRLSVARGDCLEMPFQIRVGFDAFGGEIEVRGDQRVADGVLTAGVLTSPLGVGQLRLEPLVTGALRLDVEFGVGFPPIAADLCRGNPQSLPFLASRASARQPLAPLPDFGDGWPVGRPASRGLRDDMFEALRADAFDGLLPPFDSLLIAAGGALVFEEYFFGRREQHLHTLQSCTKSVTSLVFGTLVDDGLIRDLDEPVGRYLPRRRGRRWIDEAYDISFHQVLSMSAGLEWNERIPYTDPDNDNTKMNHSDDWVGYVLDRGRQHAWPRSRFEYQSGLSLLLGELIREISAEAVEERARRRLFEPLEIESHLWSCAGDGTTHCGGGLFLRTRDFAKLGQLVLDRGHWGGRAVLSTEWIDLSTSCHASDAATDYGYQWWLPRVAGADVVMASGNGGQFLAVLRDRDVVCVGTAHDWFGWEVGPNFLIRRLLPLVSEA